MSTILGELIPDKSTRDVNQAANLIKEGLQELILCTLSRYGFFEKAVFHGGTCLRILHGLDRFSEDLDFTLVKRDLDFDFGPYSETLVKELEGLGLSVTANLRRPRGELKVYSAKFKINLREALESAGFGSDLIQRSHSKVLVVVKIDIDLDPATSVEEMIMSKKSPLEYDVRTEPLPVLFAGKTAAVLCRHWGNRVKGRDFYDFRWYVEHGIPIDIRCLESQLDKKCEPTTGLDRETLITILKRRFDTLDWDSAKDDVINFIETSQLGEWGPEPFKALTDRISVIEN